jgi:enoyl-CoA hydratase
MKFIDVEISNRVAVVTFNRPPVNALSAEAFREIEQTFRGFARSRDASVAILTAPGDRIFSAGVDLQDSARRYALQLAEGDTTIDQLDPGAVPRDCFWAVLECPLPVIGAVNGAAIGAGLALLACCDILIASENARFAVPEIKAGVLGGGRHLQRLVGVAKARKMFFTGGFESAQEFHRLGAVEKVVPPEQLMDAARELAGEIAANSPIGLRLAKESLNRVEDLPLKEGYRIEQDYTGRVTRFNDSAEARNARQEKRDPVWSWS